MKKIYIFLITLLFCFILSSCSVHEHEFVKTTIREASDLREGIVKITCSKCSKYEEYQYVPAKLFSWASYNSNESFDKISDNLLTYDFNYDILVYENSKDQILSSLETNDVVLLESAIDALDDFYRKIDNIASAAQTYYYYDCVNNESYYEIYLELFDYLVQIPTFVSTEVYPIALTKSDEIKNIVFDTTDEEEIQDIIYETELDAEVSLVLNLLEEYENEFNVFCTKTSITDSSFSEKAAQIYVKEAEILWPYAEKRNMTAYEYLSKYIYGRKYDLDSLEDFFNFIEKYNFSLNTSINLKDHLSTSETKNFNVLMRNSIVSGGHNCSGIIADDYAEHMGGSYKENYVNLWTDGLYAFSNKTDSLGTAYISAGHDQLIAMFSKNYQTLQHITHEFGHYFGFSFIDDEDMDLSYDILECHSKGNEVLFANYLKTYYPDNKEFIAYADSILLDQIDDISATALVAAMDYYVFTTKNVTEEQILSKANDINEKLNPSGIFYENYWCYGCENPGYYLSYTTSSIVACELYSLDFMDARDKYIKFCENISGESEIDQWNNAGFVNPLEDESLKNINDIIISIVNKYK